MAPGSIYIHIPFCAHKCHYCDFTAYVVGGQPVDDYLEALAREMAQTVEEIPPGKIETIFIGGGTPTVLTPRQMERLLKDIRRYFPHWSDQLEFTVEANPGTTEPDQLAVLKEGGSIVSVLGRKPSDRNYWPRSDGITEWMRSPIVSQLPGRRGLTMCPSI